MFLALDMSVALILATFQCHKQRDLERERERPIERERDRGPIEREREREREERGRCERDRESPTSTYSRSATGTQAFLSLFGGMAPCLIESAGVMAEPAAELFLYLHRTCIQFIMANQGTTNAPVGAVAHRGLWQPASILLQRHAYLSWQTLSSEWLQTAREAQGVAW